MCIYKNIYTHTHIHIHTHTHPHTHTHIYTQVAAAVAASNTVQHMGLSPPHGSLRDSLVKQEEVVANKMLSSVASYEGYARILSSAAASAAHLSAMTTPPPPTQTPPNDGSPPLHCGAGGVDPNNGFVNVLPEHHHHHHHHSASPKDCGVGNVGAVGGGMGAMSTGITGGPPTNGEEINTKELAQKISSELKRYSIPQVNNLMQTM